jgi:hypothetical protein
MKYHLHRILTDKKIKVTTRFRNSEGYYIPCKDYLNLKRKEIFYVDNDGIFWNITLPNMKTRAKILPAEKFYKCEVSYG